MAYLSDNYTNKETEITKMGNTDVEYVLDSSVKSAASDRFEIVFRSTVNNVSAIVGQGVVCVGDMSQGYYYAVTGLLDPASGEYVKMFPNPVRSEVKLEFVVMGSRVVDVKIWGRSDERMLSEVIHTS